MSGRFLAIVSIIFFLIACDSHKIYKHPAFLHEDTLLVYQKDTLPNGNIIINPNYSLIKSDTSIIRLSFFDTIPESIERSGEFYTYDTTTIAENKYIFLTDIVMYAVIRINGKDIYLHKDYDKCKEIADNVFREVYLGNGYSIVFTFKDLHEEHGVHFGTGTLDIKNAKYQTIIKIHGSLKL